MLDLIAKDIEKYLKEGSIILAGDINARTSHNPDYIFNDSDKYIPLMMTMYMAHII